jgi:HK97 family phage major capsid protein
MSADVKAPNSALRETLEGIGKAVHDLREDNDRSLDELKQGNETRYKELQAKCDGYENQITELTRKRLDQERAYTLIKDRIEILEAYADRPKGNVLVKMIDEDSQHFEKWLRSGFTDRAAYNAREELHRKALEIKVDTVTAGSALLGGNAIPKVISDQVERLILKTSGVVEAIGPKTVGTPDYHRVVTISGQSGAWAAELGSRSQGNAPNTRDIKPTQGELYAYLFATKESMQDLMFDVTNWLITDVAESHAVKLATSIFNGNGSGQCTGMTNSAPTATADYASPMRAAAVYQFVSHSSIDTSSPNKLTLDILQAAIATLAPGYRSGSRFAMSSLTQGFARRLKDTTGQYLWQPSVQAGLPDMLFGYPVFTWEDLAAGTTVDGLVAAFGNWSRSYELVNRGPLEIVTDNITTVGTTKFWVSRRWGGIPCNNDALKFVKNAD